MKKKLKDKILILDHEDYPKNAILKLTKYFDITKKKFQSQTQFEKYLIKKKFNHIFLSLNYCLKEEVLNSISPFLKTVLSPTTGKNHVDVNYLNKNKIKFIYLKPFKSVLNQINSTAELALTLMLQLLKNINNAKQLVNQNKWKSVKFKSKEVCGLKVGVIGLGRLGSKFSKYCNALSMKVYGYDTKKVRFKKYIQRVDKLEIIFKNCDVISLHADLNDKNKKFISKKYLNMMKKSSYFINTSRGELVDENYLFKILKNKKIAGAGLDVLTNEHNSEKFLNNNKIIKLSKKRENLIVTPHIGGYTEQAISLTRNFITEKFLNEFLSKNKK